MLPEIKTAYLNGRLMLFLGAGASDGSYDFERRKLPKGNDLARELAKLMDWPYADEDLSIVYSAIEAIDSSRLHEFFKNRLTNTTPSSALQIIASFPWSRVFTLNIDDCTEVALRKGKNKLRVLARNSPLEEIDPVFTCVQLIKLNGSADRPEDGFIFSPQEYGEGSNRLPNWYRELGQNYSNYSFVFIGSKLNEPLLQHALAEMRCTINRQPNRGYVITPHASEIEKHQLNRLNLCHIPGTINGFAEWMEHEFPQRPTGWDLATAKRPELQNIKSTLNNRQMRALNSVIVVGHDSRSKTLSDNLGPHRMFYKGYKPSWLDILDGVPAELNFIREFSRLVEKGYENKKCIALVGPAGSGKSTALMMAALRLSKILDYPVYFLREAVNDFKEVIVALEEINNSAFYLFIDKIDGMHTELAELLASRHTKHVCIVASERGNIWNSRVKEAMQPVIFETYKVAKINKDDASHILKKLEEFGPWTRLQHMTPDQRIEEVYNKSDRQLLIGLIETTTGKGFTDIVANDFNKAGDDEHKKFLVLIGLASIHRSTLSTNIVGSALSNLGILKDVNRLIDETEGIIVTNAGRLSARHPVYAREVFEKIAPTTMIMDCLIALVKAFSDYETPVIKNVGKADGIVFKSVLNHKFVKDMMRNDFEKVRSIYRIFETKFHIDGLYWLQYALALRAFGSHHEALEKLTTAREAYSSHHIEHSYAQQLMIIASMASDWDEAEPLLNQAIDSLRELSLAEDGADTYPIVTLAEGHISVLLKFTGIEGAKKITQKYANKLLVAHHNHPSSRIEATVNKIKKFEESGYWNESYEQDYSNGN